METDLANNPNVVYTQGSGTYGDLISLRRKSGSIWTPSYYLFDGIGSTDRVLDSSQANLATYLFRAYGDLVTSTGSLTNAFQFIGRWGYYLDSSGLGDYYVRARWYRTAIARWLSTDPLGMQFDNNLYRYVVNSPLNRLDPSGQVFNWCTEMRKACQAGCIIYDFEHWRTCYEDCDADYKACITPPPPPNDEVNNDPAVCLAPGPIVVTTVATSTESTGILGWCGTRLSGVGTFLSVIFDATPCGSGDVFPPSTGPGTDAPPVDEGKKNTCYCMCLTLDKAGPYPIGRMSPSDCKSYPQKKPKSYSYCYCK
jgi:RHS repeat-associated protein